MVVKVYSVHTICFNYLTPLSVKVNEYNTLRNYTKILCEIMKIQHMMIALRTFLIKNLSYGLEYN